MLAKYQLNKIFIRDLFSSHLIYFKCLFFSNELEETCMFIQNGNEKSKRCAETCERFTINKRINLMQKKSKKILTDLYGTLLNHFSSIQII